MMRYPSAIWRPTPKHGYNGFDTHAHEGVVIHSAEGSLAGAFSVLDGTRQASWHLFITKTGQVYQHVDTDQIAWTNGSREANTKFWGIECEGVAGEALTEPQYQALLGVVRWLWATYEVGAAVRQVNCWEHNEMTRFGSQATACPSGRIPWAALINELEDDMAEFTKTQYFEWFAEAVATVNVPRRGDPTEEHPLGEPTSGPSTLAEHLQALAQDAAKHTGDANKHSAGEGHKHGVPAHETEEA